MTTARLVGDQLMRDKQQKRVYFCFVLLFLLLFYLSSSCDIGESGMGSASVSFLGS